MKKGTKNLIVKTIEDTIRNLNRAIYHCESGGTKDLKHLEKLRGKVEKLQSAIHELDSE